MLKQLNRVAECIYVVIIDGHGSPILIGSTLRIGIVNRKNCGKCDAHGSHCSQRQPMPGTRLNTVHAPPKNAHARADRYEASRKGNIRHTVVPLLLLTRSTWPPSCRAKESTKRPPSPESAR